MIPLVPSRERVVGWTIAPVASFREAVVNEGRISVTRVSEKDGVIPRVPGSGVTATENSGPALVVTLRVDPEGNGIGIKSQLGIIGNEGAVVVTVEIEGPIPDAGESLRRSDDGGVQVVAARVRRHRHGSVLVELPVPHQVGGTMDRGCCVKGPACGGVEVSIDEGSGRNEGDPATATDSSQAKGIPSLGKDSAGVVDIGRLDPDRSTRATGSRMSPNRAGPFLRKRRYCRCLRA